MEAWTFIHKETNEIIRFSSIDLASDNGIEYFFSTFYKDPPWFTFDINDCIYLQSNSVNDIDSVWYNRPKKYEINLSDYKITTFKLLD